MPTLHIEHTALDFDAWKGAFDSDPADREGSGVRRYRVFRGVSDPNFVIIHLEFDALPEAEGMLARLLEVWDGPGMAFTVDPKARIVETVESEELA